VAITGRQRCHYLRLTQQHAARQEAIRALVTLAEFREESDAAMGSLRLLGADAVEIEAEVGSRYSALVAYPLS